MLFGTISIIFKFIYYITSSKILRFLFFILLLLDIFTSHKLLLKRKDIVKEEELESNSKHEYMYPILIANKNLMIFKIVTYILFIIL